ncbi:MAG: 16S rRNA (cytosine(1402)-N(4))-methyltransferase, partial [Planctomycetota bacterium]
MEHRPVLVAEVLDLLAGPAFELLVDATVGGGGHAGAFLREHPEGSVIGLDRDGEILEETRNRLETFGGRARLRHAEFANLGKVLDAEGARAPDAVLFDLGASSPQLDTAERGFSFRRDGPLDMRMD